MKRCAGWNFNTSAVLCGDGYDDRSYRCSLCKANYYDRDGECLRCPSNAGGALQLRWVPIAVSAGLAVCLFLVLFMVLRVVFRRHGVPISFHRSLILPFQYVMWMFVALQLLAQVGRASSPGLPEYFRRIFDIIQLVQLDFGGLAPPECDPGSPFPRYILLFVVELSMLAWWVTMSLIWRCVCDGRLKGVSLGLFKYFRYFPLATLIVLYPTSMNSAATMLECTETAVGENSVALLWDQNPYYECFAGAHTLPAVLAILVVVCVGLSVPVSLLFIGRSVVGDQAMVATDKLMKTRLHRKRSDSSASPSSRGSSSRRLRSGVFTSRDSLDKGPPVIPSSTETRIVGRGHRCRCCPQWCCLSPEVHRAVRRLRPWSPIFGHGQPWFRPADLALFFLLAFLQWLPDTTLTERLVVGGLRVITVAAYAVTVFTLKPDHEWGLWRRLPRLATGVVSALVAAMQLSFMVDVATAADIGDAEQQPFVPSYVEPLKTAVALPQPSLVSSILMIACFTLIVALPVIQFVSFLLWLRGMLPPSTRCCCRHQRLKDDSGALARVGEGLHRASLVALLELARGEQTQPIPANAQPHSVIGASGLELLPLRSSDAKAADENGPSPGLGVAKTPGHGQPFISLPASIRFLT